MRLIVDKGKEMHKRLHGVHHALSAHALNVVCTSSIFGLCLEQLFISENLRDASIISLYKDKEGKADWENYKGIPFLSVAVKVFFHILLNRLIIVSETNLPESQ